jgi:DNA-binding transcriptional MerR regulator
VAKPTELTTRTLRYWEEVGLVSQSSSRPNGQRLYSPTHMARVIRIRDLQKLLGSPSLKCAVVLGTEAST